MLITQKNIENLIKLAKECPRLRMNQNIHESLGDAVQRMFNAIEPNSIIPIARHPSSNETLILVQGSLRVLIYNDSKKILEDVILDRTLGNIGYHIPKGTWHKVVSLEEGTVLFETREGPYEPVKPEDILD